MLVIRDKSEIKIKYPIENIADKDKLLFFDIETTGFSRKYCNVYLIGCMYYIGDNLMYTQWLAENFNDEANVLMAFHKFIEKYDTIIHFNGNSFDMPFLQERGEKYKLDFNFDRFKSIDLYKPVSKLNHILKMDNQRQKTFEQLLGIKRTDPFSGGDLVEVYKQYVESKDDRLIFPLLLHNKEDVWNMGELTSLLSISDFFDGKYNLVSFNFNDFKTLNGDIEQELCISLELSNEIPVPISYGHNGIYLRINNTSADISIRVISGTYKYFFDNYKDYYYLTTEDRAMHKSVAGFVDSKFRKQATASTCYERFSGSYLPIFNTKCNSFTQIFKENHNDKIGYIKTNTLTQENIQVYIQIVLDYLKQKPTK